MWRTERAPGFVLDSETRILTIFPQRYTQHSKVTGMHQYDQRSGKMTQEGKCPLPRAPLSELLCHKHMDPSGLQLQQWRQERGESPHRQLPCSLTSSETQSLSHKHQLALEKHCTNIAKTLHKLLSYKTLRSLNLLSWLLRQAAV